MIYRFMEANKNLYAITKMAVLLGVSRSAYYQWLRGRPPSQREEADKELLRLIREIVCRHHYRYGSPRVRQTLRKVYGKQVSLKKVARIMRENKLNARIRGKFIPTTDSKHSLDVCENILNREFHGEAGGQKWVSDITYLRNKGGWLYLTTMIDLFDRKVIGWAISTGLKAEQTSVPAFEMAVKNRKPKDGLIFHSDRGVQYCAKAFRDILIERCPTVKQSMSRKGNCRDNAPAESFFKTLKRELETLDGKHSAIDVRQSVFMYIEAYYNRVRLHSALDYIAPNVFNLGDAA